MIVLRLARSVLGDLDVNTVLERIVDSARELTRARYAALGVLDESRASLERFITAGIDDDTRHAIGPLPTGRGVLGELIRNPAPLRLENVGIHPRSYGFPVGHPPMRTFLGAPVLVDGKPFGNLYLTEKEGGREFTEDDEEALVILAEFAGGGFAWDLRPASWERHACAVAGRTLTRAEWNDLLPDRPYAPACR